MKFFGPPDIQRLKARKDSDALMHALRHDLSPIRQEAAAALGELGVGAAVGALCELVERDELRNVRWTAAKALGALGDDAASPALQAALGDRDAFVRRFAAEALVAIGGSSAIRAVLGALDHDDAEVARIAREGLVTIASTSAKAGGDCTASLLEALHTNAGPVRAAVARALAAASWDAGTGTGEQQLHYAAGLRRWERWEQLAVNHVDTVCRELAGGDRAAFAPACRVLAELGGEQAIQALTGALRALPFGVSSYPADALDRLGWVPSNGIDAAFLLIARLRPGDRPAALLALGHNAFEALEQALPRAPELVSVVLAALGDLRAVPLLAREIDRADRAGNTCVTIIESIAKLGGPEARQGLEALRQSANVEDNRVAAQTALRELT